MDPLIAEAKRRMRRRRLLVAAMVVVLAGSALGAVVTLGRSAPPGSAFNPSPAQTRLSPLSNLATRRRFCGNRYSTCHSSDGKWSIVFINRSAGPITYSYANGKVTTNANHKVGCTFIVTNLATGHRKELHIGVPACRYSLFVGQTYFVQDPLRANPGGRMLGVEPPSLQVKTLAYFNDYIVSPDERWIVGEAGAQDGADGSKVIAAFSTTSHACRLVARATRPSQNLSVERSGWEFAQSPRASLTFKDPVDWRNVVQDGTKLQVVTGPGPGFTRDSQNVIVAEYQWKTKEIGLGVTHRRLVKFNLSSLQTPCPASVAPPG